MTATSTTSTRLLQKAPISESSTWLSKSTAGYVRSGRSANPLSITISYVCASILLDLFSSSPSEQDRLDLARRIQEHMDFTYEGGLVKSAGACESAAVGATMLLVRYHINNPSARFPVDHLTSYFQAAFFIAGRKLDRNLTCEVGWWRLFGNPIHDMATPALRKGLREHTSIDREACEIIMEDVWGMLAHPVWIDQVSAAFPSRAFDSPLSTPPSPKSSLFSRITRSRPSAHWTAIVHAQCKSA